MVSRSTGLTTCVQLSIGNAFESYIGLSNGCLVPRLFECQLVWQLCFLKKRYRFLHRTIINQLPASYIPFMNRGKKPSLSKEA